ncbi:MAG: HEPN domain-containing protein [Nitrososphaerota archaeon]
MSYERWRDWLDEARDDFSSAELLLKNGKYSKVCFLSHQAGEKAVKALLILKLKKFEVIHSVAELLRRAGASDEFIQLGLELDKHYVLARYPNAWPHGSPSKIYRREEAEKALDSARRILEYVEREVEAYLK